MTVTATTRRAGPFTGTGALVSYPFTFKVFAATDIGVTIANTSGVEAVLVKDSTFLVTLNPNQDTSPGGSVQYAVAGVATALPAGYLLVVTGDALAFEQSTDLPTGGSFDPTAYENALDKLAMQIQVLRDNLARSATLPATATADVELPAPAASKLLGWDVLGTALVNYDQPGTVGVALADLQSTLAGKGASLVGVQDAAGEFAATNVEAALAEIASWQFGDPIAKYGTSANLTAALDAAEAALSGGALVTIPRGTWSMTTGFVHAGQRFNTLGEGRQVTNIDFQPSGASSAITLDNVSAGGMFEPSIVGFGFTSGGGNTQTKTAIELKNVANAHIRDIAIATGAWLGTGSTFLKTTGRQALHLHGCDVACDRPLLFSQNAAFTQINDDHYLIEHTELIGTSASFPCIEFSNGVMHSNTTLRNLAIVQGGGGIKWVSTTTPGSSYKFKLENARFEQSLDTASWCLDMQENTGGMVLQDIVLDNVYFDTLNNGARFRNAKQITLRNCTWPAGNTKVALDITFVTGTKLILENCLSGGATFTFTNARCVRREEVSTVNGTPGIREEWVFFDATNYAVGCQQSDVFWGGVPVSVANNGTLDIADANFTGFFMISTSEDTSAIYSAMGGTGLTVEVADPNGLFTPTVGAPASVNVYWNGGTSRYRLENKRGSTLTFSVFRIGTNR